MYLRASTASQEIVLGHFVDSTDGNTEETALSIANTDIKLWKHGATTLANKNSGGATHISNGVYSAVLDDTDTNTVGNLEVLVHVTGALPIKREFVVLPAQVFDSLVLGSDLLQVDVQQNGNAAGTFSGGRAEILLSATAKTDVNAEVVDALNVDTYAEIGQEAPAATQTLRKMIAYLYKAWRNRTDQTNTTYSLYNDDATTVAQKATVSDDGTTFTRGEVATGP